MLTSNHFKSSEVFVNCTTEEIFSALDVPTIVYNITYAVTCLEIIRNRFDFPFKVNSWYRGPDHNKRVGGVPTSAHLEGLAIDLALRGEQAKQVVDFIKYNIDKHPIDQLIVYPTFIHIAFSDIMPRRQILYKSSS